MTCLDEKCKICGREWGEHRHSDNSCPPDDEETIDHKSKWKATKFKPVDADDLNDAARDNRKIHNEEK
jgi:hypothetical protein